MKLVRCLNWMIVWNQTVAIYDLEGRFIAEFDGAAFDILGARDIEGDEYIVLYFPYGTSTVIRVSPWNSVDAREVHLQKVGDYLEYKHCPYIKLQIATHR